MSEDGKCDDFSKLSDADGAIPCQLPEDHTGLHRYVEGDGEKMTLKVVWA